MYNFVDVYKRPLKIGDVVLCSAGYTVGYLPSNYVSDGNLVILGKEIIADDFKDDKIFCYKVEDPVIKQLAVGFDYKEWFKRYSQAGNIVNINGYDCATYRDIIEMCGRTLKAGDFIIYDFKKTKANYGIVVGRGEILTETGVITKKKYGLLIENTNIQESKIKAELIFKYNQIVQDRMSREVVKSSKDLKSGGIYLSKDNKSICIYISNVGYTLNYKSLKINTKSPQYDTFVIQMPVSMKIAKEIQECLAAKQAVVLSDVMTHIVARDRNEFYLPWDVKLGEKLYDKYECGLGLGKTAEEWSNCYADPYYMENMFFDGSIIRQLYQPDSRVKVVKLRRSKLKQGATLFGSIQKSSQVVLVRDNEKEIIMNL